MKTPKMDIKYYIGLKTDKTNNWYPIFVIWKSGYKTDLEFGCLRDDRFLLTKILSRIIFR